MVKLHMKDAYSLTTPEPMRRHLERQNTAMRGSFYIFGHGGCLGDPGHCDVHEHREPYDFRPPHPLTPALKRVTVTQALRQLAATTKETTITIVPVVNTTNELCDNKNVFRCEDMRFLTYNG
jgi:tyrosinase